MLHELAHKIVAQRNGAWAEFRAYPLGLVLAVVSALLGFILAAPGAVYIQGAISRKQDGKISIAGPLTNLGLGLAFLGLGLGLQTGLLAIALYWIGSVNMWTSPHPFISAPSSQRSSRPRSLSIARSISALRA